MDSNNEEAVSALSAQPLLPNQVKQSVNEKHMPIKKRVWKMEAGTGKDDDDKIIETGEECSQNAGTRCPRCDFVIPPKRSRGEGFFDVTNDESEKGHDSKTIEPAGLDTECEKDREGKKQEGSDIFKESLVNGTDIEKNGKEVTAVELNAELSEVDNKKKPDNESIEVPNSKFYEFDDDRKEECFVSDHVWAVYGYMDGMPRFYAQIKEVFSPGFKVRITWLEANPDNQDEIDWICKDLPVSCGKFEHGKSEITEDIRMFSHSVIHAKSTSRGLFEIYPRKGETWALFKNWHIKWSSDSGKHRNYEYDLVEIMVDYNKGSGFSVAYLEKVNGFISLFRPKKGVTSFQIPANELYRFSHMVPSYRTTGKERDGVPKGYFELDPDSLPSNLVEDGRKRSTPPQQWQNSNLPVRIQPRAGNSFGNITGTQSTSVNLHWERNQPGLNRATFWTACPHCAMRYKYYKDVLNRVLQCENCKMPFIAYGLNFQDPASLPAYLVDGIKERPTLPQLRKNSTLPVQKHPGVGNSFGNISRTQFRSVNLRQEQNQPGRHRSTFWIACPSCKMEYQYYKDVLKRALHCPNCMKPFIAHASNVKGVPSGTNWKGV